MTKHITEEGSRFDDYDFKEVMKYAPFGIGDIEEIVACVPGEADGPSWHYVCKLKNNKWGYVTGSCDYTGWGCQEEGRGQIFERKDMLIKFLPIEETWHAGRKIRETLVAQMEGKEPYGLITLK